MKMLSLFISIFAATVAFAQNPAKVDSAQDFIGRWAESTTQTKEEQLHAIRTANAVAKAMVTRFTDSWNRADGQAYGENYWPEAELVDPSGVIADGKTAIVQEHVELWNGIFKGSHATGEVRKVRMLGSDYMVVDSDVQVSNVRQLPPGSPVYPDNTLRNHLKHILEKRNGVWKVVSAQNTFIAPDR